MNREFDFDLDPCATHANHKCLIYYTEEQDGLKQDWRGHKVFCNPPYSKIDMWVEKAYREGTKDNTLVCLLIPSRTDTKYFHDYILHRSEIRFVKGRIKFGMLKIMHRFRAWLLFLEDQRHELYFKQKGT